VTWACVLWWERWEREKGGSFEGGVCIANQCLQPLSQWSPSSLVYSASAQGLDTRKLGRPPSGSHQTGSSYAHLGEAQPGWRPARARARAVCARAGRLVCAEGGVALRSRGGGTRRQPPNPTRLLLGCLRGLSRLFGHALLLRVGVHGWRGVGGWVDGKKRKGLSVGGLCICSCNSRVCACVCACVCERGRSPHTP
jgi:hypothetical protein